MTGTGAADRLHALAAARVRVPVLVASGVLGALAYPRLGWWLLTWVFLAPAFALALARGPRAALLDGWLAGTVFFVVLLSWLDHTFTHYSAIPWPLSWLPIAALAAYCGLYLGLVCLGLSWLAPTLGGGALAAAPLLWVAGEWIRGWLMDGFPWGLVGYSQHAALAVIQIADVSGVYGVSFVVVAANSALAAILALPWRRAAPGIAGTLLLVGASIGYGVLALRSADAAASVPVAVIQPSVAQAVKWDPASRDEILDRYERLTREAARSRPVLVVWPETAAPIFLRGEPDLLRRLTGLAAEVGTPLLVGSVDRQPGPQGGLLNSAFLLTGQGITAKYDKMHLVPFGEYVPLSGLIGFVRNWAEFISDFAAGEQATVFPLEAGRFGTVICYEVIFPELFRRVVAGGASFMTNITNDAWFGETSGPWQHLATLPLRAVEHRVSIARAANTGISAFVEPSGRITTWLPLNARGVLERRVTLRREPTVYTRYGDWLPWGCCLGAAAMVMGSALARRSTR